MKKPADTEHDLHALIKERWSPRAFNSEAKLADTDLRELFEAARWAPSYSNNQPWRFLYGIRGDATFAKILENVKPNNARWAFRAAALVVVVARAQKPDGGAETHSLYDTGQAVALLTVQAQHRGLSVHQMGGFLPSVNEALGIPSSYRAIVVMAIGGVGEATLLEEDLYKRELALRSRLPLTGIARNGDWDSALET